MAKHRDGTQALTEGTWERRGVGQSKSFCTIGGLRGGDSLYQGAPRTWFLWMCLQIIFFLWFFFEESVFSFPSCLSVFSFPSFHSFLLFSNWPLFLRILRPINSCDFLPGFLWYSVPFCFILIYLFCLGRVHDSLEHVALIKLQFVPLWGQVFSFMTRFRMKTCSVEGTFLGKDVGGWPWIVWGRLRNQVALRQNTQGVGAGEGGWKRPRGAVLWSLERRDFCHVIPSGLHPTGKNLGAQINWIHLGNQGISAFRRGCWYLAQLASLSGLRRGLLGNARDLNSLMRVQGAYLVLLSIFSEGLLQVLMEAEDAGSEVSLCSRQSTLRTKLATCAPWREAPTGTDRIWEQQHVVPFALLPWCRGPTKEDGVSAAVTVSSGAHTVKQARTFHHETWPVRQRCLHDFCFPLQPPNRDKPQGQRPASGGHSTSFPRLPTSIIVMKQMCLLIVILGPSS